MESQDQDRQHPSRSGATGPAEPAPRLLEQVRNVMRLHHYSIHTERSYLDWIKRYILFHRMRSRDDLVGGESKIEAFCTDLAVNGKVAAATQNQAFNALVFLYRPVLKVPLAEKISAIRAERKLNLPVVLTREEVVKVISLLRGESQLTVTLQLTSCSAGPIFAPFRSSLATTMWRRP